MKKNLVVILGPTGIGKTRIGIEVAKHFNTEIISSDSRQVYKELNIGTAKPTNTELAKVKHHLIGHKSIQDYFNAYMFEVEALTVIKDVFAEKDIAVVVGGSMLYIDALCNGIDDLPTIDEEIRENLKRRHEKEGLESLRMELARIDPVFYNQVDLKNHKRILKALEIYYMTGKPYSTQLTHEKKIRPFNIIKIGINMNRDELYNRINNRVDSMIENGLIEEAREFYQQKGLNALNTVGYKELFDYFEGIITKEKAIELIKRNSRRYAKRQLSWFNRDDTINWYQPNDEEKIINFLKEQL
jgi:tRNA dimethylallyltransferase